MKKPSLMSVLSRAQKAHSVKLSRGKVSKITTWTQMKSKSKFKKSPLIAANTVTKHRNIREFCVSLDSQPRLDKLKGKGRDGIEYSRENDNEGVPSKSNNWI